MPILPLPQFEADLKEQQEADRKVYDALKTPKTLVVRFGYMKLIGEYAYDGDIKPGCGSKIVVRTHRGVEIGEMLTSTCPNSGCSKSVSRKDMLDYIENSGGKDYPFFTEGKAYRVATPADMDKQAAIEQEKNEIRIYAKAITEELKLPMKIVEAEPIFGGERITIFYLSEERIDFRELVGRLGRRYHTRVEMHQVGARDEARITADYERCGQYCCCKNFLKVLKPVSMKSAKVQKATLDPLKISGRCGRLMCCLRYEDQTYEDLSKRLPRKKSRVGTPEGDGFVIDSQILTQLVLVRLDDPKPDGTFNDVAVPVENLAAPKNAVAPPRPDPYAPPQRPMRQETRPDNRPDARPENRDARPPQPRPDSRDTRDTRPPAREQNRDQNRDQGPRQDRGPEREQRGPGGPPRNEPRGPQGPRDGGRDGPRDGRGQGPRGPERGPDRGPRPNRSGPDGKGPLPPLPPMPPRQGPQQPPEPPQQ